MVGPHDLAKPDDESSLVEGVVQLAIVLASYTEGLRPCWGTSAVSKQLSSRASLASSSR